VMWLIASGKHINEIAAEMFLSPSTISTYRARILKKLGLSNNAALVRYAVKYRLIQPRSQYGLVGPALHAYAEPATCRSNFGDSGSIDSTI